MNIIYPFNPCVHLQPPATPKPLNPHQVREQFRRKGITFTQWAKQHGYKRHAVYRVLNGFDKAYYGQAHEIAVKLGMKAPINLTTAA